jgi:hypothetical protein
MEKQSCNGDKVQAKSWTRIKSREYSRRMSAHQKYGVFFICIFLAGHVRRLKSLPVSLGAGLLTEHGPPFLIKSMMAEK